MRNAIKKKLETVGLLEPVLEFKRKFIPAETAFRPCTPHLLVAVSKAILHLSTQANAPRGDYAEFGIFRGFTLWYAQQIAKAHQLNSMRFFGFDSFMGLPELKSGDQDGEFEEGQYQAGRKYVENVLTNYAADWTSMKLVEGFYSKSLNETTRKSIGLEKVALAVIDCDLYSSAKESLTFLGPLLQNGSIVLFDDWNSYEKADDKGERRAFREFLAENPSIKAKPFTDFGDHGTGFIIQR